MNHIGPHAIDIIMYNVMYMKGVDAKTNICQSDFFRVFGFSYNFLSSLNDGETGFGKNSLHPHLF